MHGILFVARPPAIYWLARRAGDVGCVIDGGAFLGGSTAPLADGLSDHPHPLKKVHSFDPVEGAEVTLTTGAHRDGSREHARRSPITLTPRPDKQRSTAAAVSHPL